MPQGVMCLGIIFGLAAAVDGQPPAKRTAGSSPTGGWLTKTSISKMDDSRTVVLSLSANSSVTGWPGKTVTPTLIVRCQEGEVAVYVVTGMPPKVESGGGDEATVQVRFDRDPAEERTLGKSTDGEALFFRNPKGDIPTMLEHQSLLLRFTPFNSSPQETTFSLRGLGSAIKPLYDACQWSPEIEAAQRHDEAARLQKAQEQVRAKAEKAVEDNIELAMKLLKDPKWLMRAQAATRIREIAAGSVRPERAAVAVPALIEALEDPDSTVRNSAAMTLGVIGVLAHNAIPALEAAARDEKRGMKMMAEEAIGRIQRGSQTPQP